MMKISKYLVIVIISHIFLTTGCDEPIDIEPGFEEDPVFYVDAILNTTPVTIEAGIDGYGMAPETYVNADQIVTYRSTFREINCAADCQASMEFEFLEGDVIDGPGSGYPGVIRVGQLPFFEKVETEPAYLLSASAGSSSSGGQSMFWILENGATLTDSMMAITITGTDPIRVCMRSQGTQACNYSQCIMSTGGQEPTSCATYVEIQPVNAFLVKLTAISSGTPPFAYVWGNGDFKKSIFMPIVNGFVQYALFVRDGNGCTNVIEHTFPVRDGVAGDCQPPIDLHVEETPVENTLQFGTVRIKWTDQKGAIFTSWDGPQSDSTFEILSVEPYTDQDAGGQYMQVAVSFTTTLYQGDTGESIRIEDGKAILAVAIEG